MTAPITVEEVATILHQLIVTDYVLRLMLEWWMISFSSPSLRKAGRYWTSSDRRGVHWASAYRKSAPLQARHGRVLGACTHLDDCHFCDRASLVEQDLVNKVDMIEAFVPWEFDRVKAIEMFVASTNAPVWKTSKKGSMGSSSEA
eukprot:PhF_6_TR36174/c1_g3_i4/m.52685